MEMILWAKHIHVKTKTQKHSILTHSNTNWCNKQEGDILNQIQIS